MTNSSPFLKAANWQLVVNDRWGVTHFQGPVSRLNWPDANTEPNTYYYSLWNPDGLSCKGWVEVAR